MTQFQGFATIKEAKAFQKNHKGILTYEKRTKKGKPTGVGVDYEYAVMLGGLNREKYPYCVQCNI